MTAGVPDVGERVELRAECHVQRARAGRRAKGRGQTRDTTLHVEAGRFGGVGDRVTRDVDEVTEGHQLSARRLDSRGGAFLGAHSISTTTSPAPTWSPVATLTLLITPDFSALTAFSIFIASRITTVSPASTL